MSLAFVWGIHRWPVNSSHKWPVTRKMFPFDDVIMKFLTWTRLSTWAKWGGIWTEAWVCLHYWVEIWVAGYLNFPLYCTVYGVCHRQDTLWPKGRILFWTFYCLPLSSRYKTDHRRWAHVNACRVLSCGGVSNTWLVLSIIFHRHYNILGCMCSTGPL